jgi:hypothetical protein
MRRPLPALGRTVWGDSAGFDVCAQAERSNQGRLPMAQQQQQQQQQRPGRHRDGAAAADTTVDGSLVLGPTAPAWRGNWSQWCGYFEVALTVTTTSLLPGVSTNNNTEGQQAEDKQVHECTCEELVYVQGDRAQEHAPSSMTSFEGEGGSSSGTEEQGRQQGGFSLGGRSDDVMLVAGNRVGTGEVEGALLKHRALFRGSSVVANVAVCGAPDALKVRGRKHVSALLAILRACSLVPSCAVT